MADWIRDGTIQKFEQLGTLESEKEMALKKPLNAADVRKEVEKLQDLLVYILSAVVDRENANNGIKSELDREAGKIKENSWIQGL